MRKLNPLLVGIVVIAYLVGLLIIFSAPDEGIVYIGVVVFLSSAVVNLIYLTYSLYQLLKEDGRLRQGELESNNDSLIPEFRTKVIVLSMPLLGILLFWILGVK